MRVLFILLSIVGSYILLPGQTLTDSKLNIGLSIGTNLPQDGEPSRVIPGDGRLRPSFGLSVTKNQAINEKIFWSAGLGIRYNAITINGEAFNGASASTVMNQVNANSWRRDSRVRYLSLEVPLSLGASFGKNQQWQSSLGVFGSYRFANFTRISQETIERYGWVNVINPDGSLTQRWRPLPIPYVTNTDQKKATIPADSFQYGIRTHVGYFIGEKFQKTWNIGLLVDHFLSENNVTESSNLRWHFALNLSTTL